MSIERAFELAERGLDSGDQEVLLSAVHLFEAVLVSTTDARMRQLIADNVASLKEKRKELKAQHEAQLARERELDARLMALRGSSTLEALQDRLSAMRPAPSPESLASLNQRLSALTGKPPIELDTSMPIPVVAPTSKPLSFEEEAQLLIQQVMDEVEADRKSGRAS